MAEKIVSNEELDKVTGGTQTIKGVLCDKYTVTNPEGEELADIAKKCSCGQADLVNLNDLAAAGLMPIGTELFYPSK